MERQFERLTIRGDQLRLILEIRFHIRVFGGRVTPLKRTQFTFDAIWKIYKECCKGIVETGTFLDWDTAVREYFQHAGVEWAAPHALTCFLRANLSTLEEAKELDVTALTWIEGDPVVAKKQERILRRLVERCASGEITEEMLKELSK